MTPLTSSLASNEECGMVPAVAVALHVVQANVSEELARVDLFLSAGLRSGCCWQCFADLIPGTDEAEAKTNPISCQFSEEERLP